MTIDEAMTKCEEIMRAVGANAEWIVEDNPIELHSNIGLNEDNEFYVMTEEELWGEN